MLIHCTIYLGATAAERLRCLEQLIAQELARNPATRIERVLEGGWLANLPVVAPSDAPNLPPDSLHTTLIAPGCACCTGNLVFRTTLNKLIRKKPDLICMSLAIDPEHIAALNSFLNRDEYRELLSSHIISLQ